MTMSTLFTGISELRTVSDAGTLNDAALVVTDGTISWVGPAEKAPAADDAVDLGGRAVLPGWVDSHTHMIFDGDRSAEFEARMGGGTYQAGALLSPWMPRVRQVRSASKPSSSTASRLLTRAAPRRWRPRPATALTPSPRFSPHRWPPATSTTLPSLVHTSSRQELQAESYLDEVVGPMLDGVAPYVQWIDVFCERGAFDEAQSRRVLAAGIERGLGVRVHGNQLAEGPGVALAVEMGAASVDHVNYLSDADVEALASSNTVATMLPACDLSTREPLAPGRRLLDAGATVAIASNLNPGTSYTSSMNFCVTTAVLQQHLSLDEAIRAATYGGAQALRRHDVGGGVDAQGLPAKGTIVEGAAGDLHVLDAPSAIHLAYRPGMPMTWRTYVAGKRAF